MPMMIPPARRRFGRWWHLSLVIAAGVWTAAAAEQPQTAEEEQGKRIFQRYCAGCHGREGTGEGYRLLGADPANLTSRQTQEKSDEDLLESIHARVEARVQKVDHWRNSDQKQRWLATALLDLEPQLQLPGLGPAADLLARISDQRIEPVETPSVKPQ